MRRVVVTGLGAIAPLGLNVKQNWEGIVAAKSGIDKITSFDASNFLSQIAGEVNYGKYGKAVEDYISEKDQKKIHKFIQYGLIAADEAIKDSGWQPTKEEDLFATGVAVGSGIGGLGTIEGAAIEIGVSGKTRVSPFFIPSVLINLISGQISIKHKFHGPNQASVTACATGTHCIIDGARIIMNNEADVMVVGGAESSICPVGFAGFIGAKALSTNFNDAPTRASRPWDRDRDGFVMSEGAGVLVIEEYEHAKKRGAKIYAEIKGWGLSGDAYHITAPDDTGLGAKAAMRGALKRSGLNPEEIDYINAHGTSTPLGDAVELVAVEEIFANSVDKVLMSSTKSSIGHLLGAAGGVEAIFSVLAIRDNIAPATLNLDNPIEGTKMNLVPNKPVEKKINTVLSNSFGFGGTNASVIFGRV